LSQPEPTSVVVGIIYPTDWETRPRELLEADLQQLAALDPRVEVLEARYLETSELRGQRGADPTLDLRHLAPELSARQREAFARVEVVVAMDLPFDVAELAPRLRWVQGMGAGVSQLASAGLADAGIRLTTAAGVNAVSISEFVMARLLQMWKRLPEIDAKASEHDWQPTYGREVAGLTLGVAGLGAIGREVARRGRALGMNVLAQRRSARPGDVDPDVDELFGPGGLPEVLRRSDAVVAALPETADTVDLFDAKLFAEMRPGALFVNVGRGSAVVEPALIEALQSGHLAGAAIDVARTEPLPADSSLWAAPNLLISPHSATAPAKFWSNLHELFRDNLSRYLRGDRLRNEVDARVGG
jgi:phosphoglycerate dehydrogenase-like enzyme